MPSTDSDYGLSSSGDKTSSRLFQAEAPELKTCHYVWNEIESPVCFVDALRETINKFGNLKVKGFQPGRSHAHVRR